MLGVGKPAGSFASGGALWQAEEKENAQAMISPVNSPRDGEAGKEGKQAGAPAATWNDQCRACLGAAQAHAIIKVTEQY